MEVRTKIQFLYQMDEWVVTSHGRTSANSGRKLDSDFLFMAAECVLDKIVLCCNICKQYTESHAGSGSYLILHSTYAELWEKQWSYNIVWRLFLYEFAQTWLLTNRNRGSYVYQNPLGRFIKIRENEIYEIKHRIVAV